MTVSEIKVVFCRSHEHTISFDIYLEYFLFVGLLHQVLCPREGPVSSRSGEY